MFAFACSSEIGSYLKRNLAEFDLHSLSFCLRLNLDWIGLASELVGDVEVSKSDLERSLRPSGSFR